MKFPRDDPHYQWTTHVKMKMRQYRISESLVKRIIAKPNRVEEGIAQNTIAVMQRASTGKRKHEVWVMYQIRHQKSDVGYQKRQMLIISAWRYPGMSPPGKSPVIPDDVLAALADYNI